MIKEYLYSYKEPMQKYGYILYKNRFYHIINDIAFVVEFSKASLIYCSYYFMPLFIKSDYRYFTYGGRLEIYTKHRINPLNYSNEKDITSWFNDVFNCLIKEIIPYFNVVSDPEKLLSELRASDTSFNSFIFCDYYSKLQLKLYLDIYLHHYDVLEDNLSYIEAYIKRNFDGEQFITTQIAKIEKIKYDLKSCNMDFDIFIKQNIEHTINACGFN